MGLFSKSKAEREAQQRELRLKQTRTWPDALRVQAQNISASCQNNFKKYNGIVSYNTISMNKKEYIFYSLSETSMLQGRVNAIGKNIIRGGNG